LYVHEFGFCSNLLWVFIVDETGVSIRARVVPSPGFTEEVVQACLTAACNNVFAKKRIILS
jgi:hypothetical protein